MINAHYVKVPKPEPIRTGLKATQIVNSVLLDYICKEIKEESSKGRSCIFYDPRAKAGLINAATQQIIKLYGYKIVCWEPDIISIEW